ncbi:3-oxoacyl-[acyl-carrier protein] reductase [Collimonas sp. OK307]|uniref:hypothetical protein n=1 Tax=Collimonas sp. OK307 TaxID=1801620 RepID=UPI0008DF7DB6|nr:hypothetical protein [Collimonas sp. OK307]SFI18933.1 3-oxoacyl-[acyl-carrier protein] reductase [Collimonas sp. OK307]
MSDLLMKLGGNPIGAGMVKMLGLPAPVELARSKGPYAARPLVRKNILLGRSPNGYAIDRLWVIALDAGAVSLETLPESTAPGPDILIMRR